VGRTRPTPGKRPRLRACTHRLPPSFADRVRLVKSDIPLRLCQLVKGSHQPCQGEKPPWRIDSGRVQKSESRPQSFGGTLFALTRPTSYGRLGPAGHSTIRQRTESETKVVMSSALAGHGMPRHATACAMVPALGTQRETRSSAIPRMRSSRPPSAGRRDRLPLGGDGFLVAPERRQRHRRHLRVIGAARLVWQRLLQHAHRLDAVHARGRRARPRAAARGRGQTAAVRGTASWPSASRSRASR